MGLLDGPSGWPRWTDQLDGPAGQSSWVDQFSIFEAMASSLIQRLAFQFLHCRSFQVRRRPCFLLDHNGQTRVYRLVLGPMNVLLRKKHDYLMEEDDCAPPHVN